ncbi:methyl-accepting chemotaxis protein, partial [Schlegelella sp. S2-27]
SAQAAKEIKTLIGASVEKVESGAKLVQNAGSTMTEIVASVQRVSDIIGEITAATAEQSSGIGQVNTAVTQLDQMTQQNAALVEESAAAAASLKDQAYRLADVVSAFKLTQGAQLKTRQVIEHARGPAPVSVPAPALTPGPAAPHPAAARTEAVRPAPQPTPVGDDWTSF